MFPFFCFATLLGAINLAFAGFIFTVSALKDEKPKTLEGIIQAAQGRRRRK